MYSITSLGILVKSERNVPKNRTVPNCTAKPILVLSLRKVLIIVHQWEDRHTIQKTVFVLYPLSLQAFIHLPFLGRTLLLGDKMYLGTNLVYL